MQSVVYMDGRHERLDADDRGLAYGDGLFETMLATDGRVRWLDFHLDRLAAGCQRLKIEPPDRQETAAEIGRQVPRSGQAVVKLTLTRGSGERGYAPPGNPVIRVLLAAFPREAPALPPAPVDAATLELRLSENEATAGIKHLCRIEQVLAQLEMRARGIEEGVLLSRSGNVVGCSSSNLFLIERSGLATPRIETAGISGVMRRVVIEACRRAGIDVTEADVSRDRVRDAVGLFQTNAVIGVREIGSLDGRRYAASDSVAGIRRAIEAYTDA